MKSPLSQGSRNGPMEVVDELILVSLARTGQDTSAKSGQLGWV